MSRLDARLAISIFSRAPVPGHTKRRLIPALGAQGAAKLHKQMLRDVIETALGCETARVALACTPDTYHPFFKSLRDEFDIELVCQHGSDLGERMSMELNRRLQDHDAAVIVGSDCPFIDRSDFCQAFDALIDGARAVIGPSVDGGYYLIGLSEPTPMLFSNIEWGTGDVFENTRKRLEAASLNWIQLREHADIDRPEDLSRLCVDGSRQR